MESIWNRIVPRFINGYVTINRSVDFTMILNMTNKWLEERTGIRALKIICRSNELHRHILDIRNRL